MATIKTIAAEFEALIATEDPQSFDSDTVEVLQNLHTKLGNTLQANGSQEDVTVFLMMNGDKAELVTKPNVNENPPVFPGVTPKKKVTVVTKSSKRASAVTKKVAPVKTKDKTIVIKSETPRKGRPTAANLVTRQALAASGIKPEVITVVGEYSDKRKPEILIINPPEEDEDTTTEPSKRAADEETGDEPVAKKSSVKGEGGEKVEDKVKRFRCSECDYRAHRKDMVKMHMVVHTGDKPHKCSLCDYRSAWKNDVIKHMRIHTGERPYSCQLCDKRFTEPGGLRAHMRRHDNTKPFNCDLCDFKTKDKSYLVVHQKNHSSLKPFVCGVCSRRFAESGHLQRHMASHDVSDTHPYKCSYCNFRAKSAKAVRMHITSTHVKKTGSSAAAKQAKVNVIEAVEEPPTCDLCDEGIMHPDSIEEGYKCKLCDFKSEKCYELFGHVKGHEEKGEKVPEDEVEEKMEPAAEEEEETSVKEEETEKKGVAVEGGEAADLEELEEVAAVGSGEDEAGEGDELV